MPRFKAFIFDMNGTMVNDMHYHELAWYNVLVNRLNAPLTLEQVKHEMYGTAAEMFARVFGKGRFSDEEVEAISRQKEATYRAEFLPDLKAINGLENLLERARACGIELAIGTAAPKENVDFVLDNLGLRQYFKAIVGPEDVAQSKPHPDVFLKAASRLGITPELCLVFEDAPKGIEAAERAGMQAVGITSYHSAGDLQRKNVLCTVEDFLGSALEMLF